jgi:hypothetical protein
MLMKAHHTLTMVGTQWSHKSWIKTWSFLLETITLSNDVFQDSDSNMAVEIIQLGNPISETAESNDIVKETLGSYILTLHLQAKNQICQTLHAHFWRWIQQLIAKTDSVKLQLGTAGWTFLLWSVLSLHKDWCCTLGAQLYQEDAILSVACLPITAADWLFVGYLRSILVR